MKPSSRFAIFLLAFIPLLVGWAFNRSPLPETISTHAIESPREHEQFFAVAGNQRVELNWSATTTPYGMYVLERDGEVIARVRALPEKAQYEFVDAHLANGFQYNYALYTVNADGERSLFGAQSATPNIERNIADSYTLFQNFPNPFNPRTQIEFDLPQAGFVQLTVYNSIGQTVAVLASSELRAGRHSVTFDGTNAASGIYLYELKAGAFQQVRKMILMK